MVDEQTQLVVWSGGLDSTLVLNNLAKVSEKDNPIWAISFDTNFLTKNKIVKEKEARKNYLRYARKQGYHICHRTVKIRSDIGVSELGWPQQVFFFSFILPYIPDHCVVNIGFVQGDCVWTAVSNFREMFDKYKYVGGKTDVILKFPLAFKKKNEVLRDYRVSKIPYNCFWTCEHPVKLKSGYIRSCGRCVPCETLRTAVWREEKKFH